MTPWEVQQAFGLPITEFGAWEVATANAWQAWRPIILKQQSPIAKEWVGVFSDNLVELPTLVCQTNEDFLPKPGPGFHNIPLKLITYVVRPQSASLVEIPWESRLSAATYDSRGDGAITVIAGCIRRVRVIEVKKGPKKLPVLLYYGKTQDLLWDPARYFWPDRVPLMSYTTSLGRKFLLKTHKVPDVVEKKWSGVLPVTYKLRWLNVWDGERTKKEAGLLWAIWHKGVEVNASRGTGSGRRRIDQCCPICMTGTRETVMHRF